METKAIFTSQVVTDFSKSFHTCLSYICFSLSWSPPPPLLKKEKALPKSQVCGWHFGVVNYYICNHQHRGTHAALHKPMTGLQIIHGEFSSYNIFLQSKFYHLFSLKLVSPIINSWIRSQMRHLPRDSTTALLFKTDVVEGRNIYSCYPSCRWRDFCLLSPCLGRLNGMLWSLLPLTHFPLNDRAVWWVTQLVCATITGGYHYGNMTILTTVPFLLHMASTPGQTPQACHSSCSTYDGVGVAGM